MKKINWILLAPICSLTTLSCLPVTACSKQVNIKKHTGIKVSAGEFVRGKDFLISYTISNNYFLTIYGILIYCDGNLVPNDSAILWNEEEQTILIFSTWTDCKNLTIDITPAKQSRTKVGIGASVETSQTVEYLSNHTNDIDLVTDSDKTIKDIVALFTTAETDFDEQPFILESFHAESLVTAPGPLVIYYRMNSDPLIPHTGRSVRVNFTFWSKDFMTFYGWLPNYTIECL